MAGRSILRFLIIFLGFNAVWHSAVATLTADTLIAVIENDTATMERNYAYIRTHNNLHPRHLSDDEFHRWMQYVHTHIEHAQHDTIEYAWLDVAAWSSQQKRELGKVVTYREAMLEMAIQMKDTAKMISCYGTLGWSYSGFDMKDMAIGFAQKQVELALATKDTTLIKIATGGIGWFYTNVAYETHDKQLQDSAVKYLDIAWRLKELTEPATGTHRDAGIIYCMALARSGNNEKAIEVGKYMLRNFVPEGSGYYTRYIKQIGNFYTNLDMEDSAQYYYAWFVRQEEKGIKDFPGNLRDAHKRGFVSLNIDHQYYCNSWTAMTVAQFFYHFGHYQKVKNVTDQILFNPNMKEHGADFLIWVQNMGMQVYPKLGEYKKAVECFTPYVAYIDSIQELEKIKYKEANTAHTQIQIKLEKQRAEEERIKQELVAKEERERQLLINKFLIGGAILLLAFLGFMYNRFRVTNKQKKVIEDQHTDLEMAYGQLDEKNKEILDSINYAKRIQTAILPPSKVVKSYLEHSFILYKPKDIVAGDFYWMQPEGDTVFFAAADCTGHGVPGAMVSVICNNGLNRSLKEFNIKEPGKILDKTRELVTAEFDKSEENVQDGMDIALCALNMKQRTLQYAGAHNPLWIIGKDATEVQEIRADKQPIGKYTAAQPFTTHTVQLNEGDTIYIFSDGYQDQFGGERGKKFKSVNLKKLLLSVSTLPMHEQREKIDREFENWKGDLEQLDDVCVIGVQV